MTNHLNEDQLINYLYHLLPDAEREVLDLHLSACPLCRTSLSEYETLQRRIHYSIAARRRVTPSSRMRYVAIAPRLKHMRRFKMVFKQSRQFLYTTLTMVLLIALGVSLYFFVSNLSLPTSTTLGEVSQPERAASDSVEGNHPTGDTPIGEVKWKFETKRTIYSNPAVVEGVVYFGSGDHYLHAVDAETGQEVWEFKTEGVIQSSPRLVGDLVYIGSKDKYLYAVDRQTGQEVWKFKAGGPVISAPAIAAGLVYFGNGCLIFCERGGDSDHYLYALDSQTGREVWKFKTSGIIDLDPVVANDIVYFGSSDGYFYAVEAQTGQELWDFQTDGEIHSSPVLAGDMVYFGSNDSYLYALNNQTGQELWRFKTKGVVVPSPAVADGTVYVGSRDHYFYAVDAATGQEKWKFKTGSFIAERPPVIVKGVVYFVHNDHHLYALDSQTGHELGRFKAGDGLVAITVVDGVIYLGGDDGYLYAIEVNG